MDANTDSLKQIWTNPAQLDSIRFKAINEYYKKHLYAQPDSVILLTAYHIELAQQKHSEKEKAIALSRKAIVHSMKGDYVNALIEMNKVVGIYSSLKDSISLMKNYNNLASIYMHTVEYQKAIKYFSKCLAFYQANNIEESQAAILMLSLIHI